MIACIVCIAVLVSIVQSENRRNKKLLGPDYDAEISEELNSLAQPTIEALLEYQLDHGSYLTDIESLMPTYIEKVPSSYMRGRLVYDQRALYGVPSYFGFRGNYSGIYSWHGWSLLYCPISICKSRVPAHGELTTLGSLFTAPRSRHRMIRLLLFKLLSPV
jgi:hypothetical protein